MRTLLRIAYWPLAITILAVILVSLDYSLAQAVLIALMFCPCALVLEFWMPKARKPMDKFYLSLAVMTSVILLIVILHFGIWTSLTKDGFYQSQKDISPMLINPAFLGLILTTLSIGDYFWAKWISKRLKAKGRTITFYSERKSVTLPLTEKPAWRRVPTYSQVLLGQCELDFPNLSRPGFRCWEGIACLPQV